MKNLPQIILNFNICSMFALLSMFLLKFILPEGNTTQFLERAYILVGLIFIFLSVLFFFSLIFIKNFRFKKKIDLPILEDLILLGFPMSPVISYVILNIEYLDIIGLLYLVSIPFIFSYFFSFVLTSLFSYFGSYTMLKISGLVLSFVILNMAQITNNPTTHIFGSQFITQGLYLIISFTVIYLLYSFNKKITFIAIIAFMLSGAVISFINNASFKDPNKIRSNERLKKFLNYKKNEVINKKNIYVLIFESYANKETLEFYGLNNSEQIDFLENNNFTVYHGSYSNGAKSLSSTSRILELKNQLSKDERHYLNGNALVLDIFKANGYKTVGLFKSPYAFGSSPISWDEYYPKDDVTKIGGKTILKAIYEGYFRFDIFDDNYDNSAYLKLRNNYLSSKDDNPTLFYTHGEHPGHSQNSGVCLKNEKQKYFEGMKKANLQMKNDINVLKKNNPESIIIIAGDHGPYLTKNCTALMRYNQKEINRYDVQDRYGAFLAIHWPSDIDVQDYNIQIIQDIFPAILGNITNNKILFDQLKLDRRFLDEFDERVAGVNVKNGIVIGGKDDNKPLFENRSYKLKK